MVRKVMIYNKKPQPLTLKEKKEYIKWQIDLIESEKDIFHYFCLDFWEWLSSKGNVSYINTEYNLTLFPELLNAIKLIIKKNKDTFILDHNFLTLDTSPIIHESAKKSNIFRLEFLKNLKFK